MPKIFEGRATACPGRFSIVVARYNETITSRLLRGAVDVLVEHGISEDAIEVAWVPGAFEIPLVAARQAASGRFAAVLCLGAVIRGETTHDQHINRAVSTELARIGVDSGVPVLFGILTCDNLEQAIHRAGGNVGNKGAECAAAALEMVNLLTNLEEGEK
ncbi:MAG TPA: 6,7-dimethyl-8-ribityllumazine synthase [Pirellulales bacterium]|nr:6,7-dimethyl-8-ribityllumazine synthase [Pirellulales bacterium]